MTSFRLHRPALAPWLVGCAACLPLVAGTTAQGLVTEGLVPDLPPIAQLPPGNGLPLAVRVLDSSAGDPPAQVVTAGGLDPHFGPFGSHGWHFITTPLWFRLPPLASAPSATGGETPVLLARAGLDQPVEVFARRRGESVPLTPTAVIPQFGGQSLALTDAERRAQTDPLTGVLNRRSLIEHLDAACMRAKVRGPPLSVLFIDLDHFKQINDSCGHAAGDACLAAIIPPIQAELRQSDVIGRYGGEEFVVILSGADAAAARPIAERICRRVAEVSIEGFGAPINLTCSIGVAASDMVHVWGQHLLAHADTAQYAAKRSGRNCVQLATALA